jgi:hypothetical protein
MMACASGGWRAMISSVIPSDRPWFLPNTALPVQISLPKKSLQAVNGYQNTPRPTAAEKLLKP